MPAEFSIEARSGSILIGELCRLSAHQSKVEVEPLAAAWIEDVRDHGNCYEWLDLRGLTFAGHPAGLSLCFHDGRLEEAAWSVQLPDAPDGWPTRQAMDEELGFVRGVLAREIGFTTLGPTMGYSWGEVWSFFDPKGGIASNGLRYRHI